MRHDTRPPVGSTGTLAELQVGPGDVVGFETGHQYRITEVIDGFDVDYKAVRHAKGRIGQEVTLNSHREEWTLISRATPYQPAHIVTHNGREYDLTKLETPFGLLPKSVQEALQAWPHGWEVYDHGWWEAFKLWDTSQAYRATPAPAPVRVRCSRRADDMPIDYGTCIKRPDGSIDWDSWRADA